MEEFLRGKRLIDLTAEDFVELMAEAIKRANNTEATEVNGKVQSVSNHVWGIDGLKVLLNCSARKASQLAHGPIAPAVTRVGRRLMIDANQALQLLKDQS